MHKYRKLDFYSALVTTLFFLTACNGQSSGSSEKGSVDNLGSLEKPSNTPLDSPTTRVQRSYSTDVMLFNGAGSWQDEVSSLKNIMHDHGASYTEVSSSQLDSMSVDDMAKFGLIVFPGGSGGTEAGSLSADTHARLREAVQDRGVSYIGFCAGAFIAIAPKPAPGHDVTYGLGIVDGPELNYYFLENQGIDTAMTLETFADGSKRDLVWYGGPVTPNVKGGVIAKYPNGDPAISQMWSGNGFVIVSGPHPAALQSTRTAFGLNDSDGLDFDLAWQLLNAALHQQPLKAF